MATHNDPPTQLYRAVADGRSAEEVRAAIEACAPPGPVTRNSSRCGIAPALNRVARNDRIYGRGKRNDRNNGRDETPLQAAHRLQRGDLVGLLLEAGADAAALSSHRHHDPLALCIAYGQAGSLRALLRREQGRRGVDCGRDYVYDDCLDGPYASLSTSPLVHLCICLLYTSPSPRD